MASMLALIPFTPGINEQIPLPLIVFLLQHYSLHTIYLSFQNQINYHFNFIRLPTR
jgi:hypothetical protein